MALEISSVINISRICRVIIPQTDLPVIFAAIDGELVAEMKWSMYPASKTPDHMPSVCGTIPE